MSAVRVEVKRLPNGEGLELPAYATSGSAAVDLVAAVAEPLTLRPGARAAVPTGIAIALPDGFEGQVRPRSGLAIEHGVTVLNTPGTIDADYRGEVRVILANLGDRPFIVERGRMDSSRQPSTPTESAPSRVQSVVAARLALLSEDARAAAEVAAAVGRDFRFDILAKASDLKGCNVETSDGKKAGEIKDLAIDPNAGRIAYFVLGSGGFLGFGKDLYAVPWEAATVSVTENKKLTCKLHVPEAKFENAPDFVDNDWKRMSDPVFVREVYTYYGTPVYWKDSKAMEAGAGSGS